MSGLLKERTVPAFVVIWLSGLSLLILVLAARPDREPPPRLPPSVVHYSKAFYLCQEDVSADGKCAEFDLLGAGHGRLPDQVFVGLAGTSHCPGNPIVDIDHSFVSGGTKHNLVMLNSSATMAELGSNMVMGRFWSASLRGTYGLVSCHVSVFGWARTTELDPLGGFGGSRVVIVPATPDDAQKARR